MVLEATVIVVDNSEDMRNGDFSPSRFEAQQDACNLICGKKTSSNMENTVALIASAGKKPEVCVSLTQDVGKILKGLHHLKVEGTSDIVSAIQVAANKRQEQRVVVFVGSPVSAAETELKRLGAQLKKNKIAVDIVSFGEGVAEENRAKLEALHAAVNNHDNSFMVTLPPGEHMLSQMLSSTPIVRGVDAGEAPADGGGGMDDFGIDPNVDPELALAMRLSLESAEAERRAREDGDKPATGDVEMKDATAATTADAELEGDDMDEDMRAAIALSMQTANPGTEEKQQGDAMDVDDADDDLALAMKLSRETAATDQGKDAEKTTEKTEEKPQSSTEAKAEGSVDSDYMASVLLNLPGVDPNDPDVQAVLQGMKGEEKKDEKNDDSK